MESFKKDVDVIINDILENSHEAIGRIKELYNEGWATTLAQGLDLERAADPKLSETADMLSKFEEKKKQ